MAPRCTKRLAAVAAAATLAGPAHAAVVYSEAVSGDLSDSGLSPTVIGLAAGSNQILGSTGRNAAGTVDRDYFTVSVPAGLSLTALIELPGTTTGGAGVSFIGLQSGAQVTLAPTATSAAGLLGWSHYGATPNVDLLPAIGASGNGASGFAPPLPAGRYAFWVQELAAGSFSYGFDLVLDAPRAAVPEPTSLALAALGGVLMVAARRRPAGSVQKAAPAGHLPG